MLINEIVDIGHQAKLVALAEFLSGRLEDTAAEVGISTKAFLQMAARVGVIVDRDDLMDLVEKEPLNNLVSRVEQDKIIFKGSDPGSAEQSGMSVDQAQKTVDKMAKRAAKKS